MKAEAKSFLESFFLNYPIYIYIYIYIYTGYIIEKSSGGEFETRNSNGMVFPYSSREIMNKPFQRRI